MGLDRGVVHGSDETEACFVDMQALQCTSYFYMGVIQKVEVGKSISFNRLPMT